MAKQELFTVSKLWIDSMENTVALAVGYAIEGVIDKEDIPKEIPMISKSRCWAMSENMPKYKFERVTRVYSTDLNLEKE